MDFLSNVFRVLMASMMVLLASALLLVFVMIGVGICGGIAYILGGMALADFQADDMSGAIIYGFFASVFCIMGLGLIAWVAQRIRDDIAEARGADMVSDLPDDWRDLPEVRALDEQEPQDMSDMFEMEYRNQVGELSSRLVKVISAGSNPTGTVYMRARDMETDGELTFRADRIDSLMSVDTGRMIDNPISYLVSEYSRS